MTDNQDTQDKFVRVNLGFNEEQLKSLLTCALEGGSNYWAMVTNYKMGTGCSYLIDAPFHEGSLTILDILDDSQRTYTLDMRAITKGVQIMSEKYGNHFADFLKGNEDAMTGDVFLQCALLGDAIYG